MTIHSSRDVMLPPDFIAPNDPDKLGAAVEEYLQGLVRAFEDEFKKIHYDIVEGRTALIEFASAPTTSDLEPGQMGLSGTTFYVNVDGTIKSVALT